MTFLRGTFMRLKGPEPDITAITQDPSDPVRPGDSVTLQCSVLPDSEKKTCPEEHRVYWFRAASNESHPSFIHAQVNSSSYYCAVATCGEILFGNGTELYVEAAVTVQRNSGGRKSQQRDEDTQVYSAVVFTVMKTGSGAIKDSKERQRIYAAVKAFGLD
ncbi:hypothetical protein ABVT39_023965 [Epinephelus coioides]